MWVKLISVFKKIVFIISLFIITSFFTVAAVVWIFNNTNLRPDREYVTDYIAVYSPYVVKAFYGEDKYPREILIIKAESGEVIKRVRPNKEVARYEVKESNEDRWHGYLFFTFYDKAGGFIGVPLFDTESKFWDPAPTA